MRIELFFKDLASRRLQWSVWGACLLMGTVLIMKVATYQHDVLSFLSTSVIRKILTPLVPWVVA